MDAVRSAIRPMPFTASTSSNSISTNSEDHMITSRSNIWQHHTKHNHHRLATSPPNLSVSNASLVNSMSMNPGPPIFTMPHESSGATPTSSDQTSEYERNNSNSPSTLRSGTTQLTAHNNNNNNTNSNNNNCDNDNDEEVIVTNDEDDCPKKVGAKDTKRSDKIR